MERITSIHNPRIKNFQKLDKASYRRESGLFTVEGVREVNLCIQSGYKVHSIFIYQEKISDSDLSMLDPLIIQKHGVEISSEVYEKIAYRESTEGVLMIAYSKIHSIELLRLSENPLVLVLESVEKPGNLGAILRTADAANLDAVIVCDPKTDIYNSNVIRSSIGCLFARQVAVCNNEEAAHWLKSNKFKTFAASLQTNKRYYDVDFSHPTAIVLGTEADGLTKFWYQHCNESIVIPMEGIHDSLNVATTAAILTFEAKRQRLRG